ncbi:hypothetical protein D9M70_514930 [compost metagenome]
MPQTVRPVIFVVSTQQKDRCRGSPQQAPRRAADKKTPEWGTAKSAHDQEVDTMLGLIRMQSRLDFT